MQAACVWTLALDKDIIYIDGEEDLPCCPQKTQDWFNYFRDDSWAAGESKD